MIRRRQLLGSALALSAAMPLFGACAPAPAAPAAPAGTAPPAGTGAPAKATKLQLPTYTPIEVAKPDLPATAQGLDAAYFNFPKNVVKSVATPPGQGGDVNVFTLLQIQPPPPVDQNPAWQAVNKDVNADRKSTRLN